MNFSHYIAVYDSPRVTKFDLLVHIPGIIIGPMNVLVCSCFAVFTISDYRRFHRNFYILRFHMLVAFYCISTARTLISMITIITGNVSPSDVIAWKFGIILGGSIGTDLLRFLWASIFIERLVATIYSKEYETRKFIFLPILLTIFCYGATGVLVFLKHYLDIETYIIYGSMLATDFIIIILVYKLINYNQRLRKLTFNSSFILSERYQIAENVRVLKIMFSIIFFGTILTSLGTILRMVLIFSSLKYLFRYIIVIYYICINIYIFVSFILWIHNDEFYRNKLKLYWKRFTRYRVDDESTTQNEFVLRNVEGNPVFTNQTMDVHFNSLKIYWQKE